jgi:selenocysteine-specific elongation factor
MRRLILGTAGHIDHGKTALVHALTGTDTDRLPEEKRRGITIDLGFASLTLPSGTELGIVDVPGHEAFVRNMLAGATGIDLALLVVAADEGIMPQTREHLDILELLRVPRLVVALTKMDLVEPEWLELARDEVAETLATGPFAGAPLVPVSAITRSGLDTLVATLEAAAGSAPMRDADDLFRMPIDRVFSMQGTGTVVTGTVWSGSLTRDRTVRILPAGRDARIRGIQVNGQERDAIGPGERAAIALASIPRDATRRGDTLVSGPGWIPASMLTARVRLLPDATPLRTRRRVRFHLGTAEVLARVVVLDGDEIAPGADGLVQFRLEAPVVARARDRFVLRSYSPVCTIAGGAIIEPVARKRRRLPPDVLTNLERIASTDPNQALQAAVDDAAWYGLDATGLAIRLGTTPAAADLAVEYAAANGRALLAGGRLFDAAIRDTARDLVLATVDRVHRNQPLRAGADRDELRRALPAWTPVELAEVIIADLLRDGVIVAEASTVRRRDYVLRLSADQQAALARIAATFAAAGLAPPHPGDLPPPLPQRADLTPLIRMLEADGTLVPLRPDVYLQRDVLDRAILAVQTRFGGQDNVTPAMFRDLFGISRKHLLPLLEYLDRMGVTTRDGDVRRVQPPVQH